MHRNLPARPDTTTTSIVAHHPTPDGAKIVVEHHHYHHTPEPTKPVSAPVKTGDGDAYYRSVNARTALVAVAFFGTLAVVACFSARAAAAIVITAIVAVVTLTVLYRDVLR